MPQKKRIVVRPPYKVFILMSSSLIGLSVLLLIANTMILGLTPTFVAIAIVPFIYSLYILRQSRRGLTHVQLLLHTLIFLMAIISLGIYLSGYYLESMNSVCSTIGGYTKECVDSMSLAAIYVGYVLCVPASIISIVNYISISKKNT